MYLTQPQSSHFDPQRFAGAAPTDNHFDWELYYRFKDERDFYWIEQLGTNAAFQAQAEQHVAAFEDSIERTRALLRTVSRPRILDVGLSSEKLDNSLVASLSARLTVVDVESVAQDYQHTQDPDSRFVVGDVIQLGTDAEHVDSYDLVYSIGLVEHFPDKRIIVDAHRRLAAIGALVLIYAPIDTPINRQLSAAIPELENFGYRELLTPEELAAVCTCPGLTPIAVETVGLFGAVWARRSA